jgi:transcriptional activator SPT7
VLTHDIQELILHALHENGQVRTADLEAHIKDDIEREGGKIAEMTRKVKQSFKEVVSTQRIYKRVNTYPRT